MELERKSGIDLWRQIRMILEKEMEEGVHAPGDKLPTEHALAKRFGVNRHTVRKALGSMEQDGKVRIEQGRGTFVQENVINYVVGRRTRFSEIISSQSRIPSGVLRKSETLAADADLAGKLGISPGERVIVLENMGVADGKTISLARHYFPASRFEGLLEKFRETGSITRALAALGVEDYFRKVTRITARMPTVDEARALQQPRNRPLLISEGVNVDSHGRVIEYGVTRFASDWVQIVLEI